MKRGENIEKVMDNESGDPLELIEDPWSAAGV
jgi:hypothetical protein